MFPLVTIILIIHVLGAGVLFSVSFFSLLITTKKPVTKDRIKTIQIFEKAAPVAALTQLATGIVLYLQDMEVYNVDPVFWVKVVLYILSGIVAVRIVKRKSIALLKQKGSVLNVGKLPLWTALEILILLAIIICGVILVETV